MLVKVSATFEERKRELVIRFGLPPLYPRGKEKGRLRLPLTKEIMTDDCTFYFGRLPSLYPRRIRIINKTDVEVDNVVTIPSQNTSVWKVFIEMSPFRFEDC